MTVYLYRDIASSLAGPPPRGAAMAIDQERLIPRSRTRVDLDAQRAAEFRRLVVFGGLSEVEAEGWLVAFEREADRTGMPRSRRFWQNSTIWIACQRAEGRTP
jgi:hypothetical protein